MIEYLRAWTIGVIIDPSEHLDRENVDQCERELGKYQEYVGQKFSGVEFPGPEWVKVHRRGADENRAIYISTLEASAGRFRVSLDENKVILNRSGEEAVPAYPVT